MTPVQLQERMAETPVTEKETCHKGLCSTCRHTETCCYPRNTDEPVLFCEEFEIEKAPVSSFIFDNDSFEELPKKMQLKGLCSNCANAITCTFPKSESGVWHCEEYR